MTAMKVACAAQKEDRQLSIGFEANEVMCLAEILKEQQDLHSICTFGKPSMTHICLRTRDTLMKPSMIL